MSRKLPLRVVRTAAAQMAEASAWWEANRPKAPVCSVRTSSAPLSLSLPSRKLGPRPRMLSYRACDVSISAVFTTTSITGQGDRLIGWRSSHCGTPVAAPGQGCSELPVKRLTSGDERLVERMQAKALVQGDELSIPRVQRRAPPASLVSTAATSRAPDEGDDRRPFHRSLQLSRDRPALRRPPGYRRADRPQANASKRELTPATSLQQRHSNVTDPSNVNGRRDQQRGTAQPVRHVGKLGQQWLRATRLVVVSERAAALAQELGFKRPGVVAREACDEAIVEARREYRAARLPRWLSHAYAEAIICGEALPSSSSPGRYSEVPFGR